MGQTPIYGFHYPDGSDLVDIATHLQELALDIDGVLGTLGGKPPTRTVIIGPALREQPQGRPASKPLTEEEAIAIMESLPPAGDPPLAELLVAIYNIPEDCKALFVEGLGGGGAGGMAQTGSQALWAFAGGGNGGWYSAKLIVNPNPTYDYIVGGGGPGIPAGNNSGNGAVGGDTTFGALLVAKGGAGGTKDDVSGGAHSVPAWVEPQEHQSGSIGDVLIAGEYGDNGVGYATNLIEGGRGGKGAGPYGGNGGRTTMTGGWPHDGFAASGFGGGGSGSLASNYSGPAMASQPGYPGLLIITEFY